MKIALIRHGETDWNIQRRYQGRRGLGLNDVGRAQAQEAAERLIAVGRATGASWAWLTSSTALRAVQTARIIGASTGLVAGAQVEDLIERGFGDAEGMLIDKARTRWPDRVYPGGETTDEVLRRSLASVDDLAAAHRGVDGVIVSHGTVLRLLVENLTGIDPGSLPNAALAVIDGGPGAWRVEVSPGEPGVGAGRRRS